MCMHLKLRGLILYYNFDAIGLVDKFELTDAHPATKSGVFQETILSSIASIEPYTPESAKALGASEEFGASPAK